MSDEPLSEHLRLDQEFGHTAAISALVHRTRNLAVVANSFIAYRTGFSFVLYTVQRHARGRRRDGSLRLYLGHLGVDHKTLKVIDATGRNLVVEPDFVSKGGAERYFVLDLPSAGPMTISLDWPGRRSLRISAQLEAEPILDAAGKSAPLWET